MTYLCTETGISSNIARQSLSTIPKLVDTNITDLNGPAATYNGQAGRCVLADVVGNNACFVTYSL